MAPVASFINMGIHIQQTQGVLHFTVHATVLTRSYRRALSQKIKSLAEHQLTNVEKEVQNDDNRLRQDLKKWRILQRQIMPLAGDAVAAQDFCRIEAEILFLPSEFNKETRDKLELGHLVDVETRLREGEAHDALRDLRITVRHINALTFNKQTTVRGQKHNLRAMDAINDLKAKQKLLVEKYNAARIALIALGCEDSGENGEFPPLREEDATMRYSERPYQLGDSKRNDGPLFIAGAGRKVVLLDEPGMLMSSATNLSKQWLGAPRQGRSKKQIPGKKIIWYCLESTVFSDVIRSVDTAIQGNQHIQPSASRPKDSWIWRTDPVNKGKMTEQEIEEWFQKGKRPSCYLNGYLPLPLSGNSVQWHRAKALAERWEEELETVEEEFRRTARGFDRMGEVWAMLGTSHTGGHQAYAMQKSSAYHRMAEEAKDRFAAAGGTWPDEGKSLFDHVLCLREKRGRCVCGSVLLFTIH
jgi:hypothetical protein